MVNMPDNFLKLENIPTYRTATELADYVWNIVSKWDWFSKRTLGSQYVNAIDSIAGNVAEGFGRFHKKDKQKFYYNSRGSVYESIHWTERASNRKLLNPADFNHVIDVLSALPREINWLIKITEEKLKI